MPLDNLFNQLLASPTAKGALGGAASGALVSALMNKKARKTLVQGAATVGGMAALAGVGYYAYRKWQQHQAAKPAGPAPVSVAPAAAPQAELAAAVASAPVVDDRLGLKMLQAMIAASHADGAVDGRELDSIFNALNRVGLTPEENASLTAALDRPPTLEQIATGIDREEHAAEIYGAALLVIERATPAEQFFLQRLAHQLRLPAALRQQIHNTATLALPSAVS